MQNKAYKSIMLSALLAVPLTFLFVSFLNASVGYPTVFSVSNSSSTPVINVYDDGEISGGYFVSSTTIASMIRYASSTAFTSDVICLSGDSCIDEWPTGGGGGGGAVFDTTMVFTGTSPTSFTDLDLSSVIGANQKMVQLVIHNANRHHFVQRNGTSRSFSLNTSVQPGGTQYYRTQNIGGGAACTVVVATDTSGVIEWATNGGIDTQIYLEAYW